MRFNDNEISDILWRFADKRIGGNKQKVIHRRAEIWNFSPSVQIEMSIVRYADSRDLELNTSRETPHLQATKYYLVYHINTSQTRNSENTMPFIHCAKQCGRHVRSCLALSNTRAKKSSSFFTTSVFSQWWKSLKKTLQFI